MTTHSGEVFTVVWEGIRHAWADPDWLKPSPSTPEVLEQFSTVVRPNEYGYSLSPSNEELGICACAEVHDGENPYDEVNVLFVYFGDNKPIDIPED